MKRWWRQRQNRIDMAVLGSMLMGDTYFAEIWQRIGGSSARIIVALDRFEREGRVMSAWARQRSGELQRRYFLANTRREER
jgi:predicted transcriptional regulator